MKQEKAERERSRPPRLRLGQERRWETRAAPPLQGPASLGPPPTCPPGLLTRASGAAGARTLGMEARVRGSVGEGLPASVEGGGGQARPAGRVSPLRAGSEDIAGEGAGGRPCPGPLGKARLPLLSAQPPRKQSRVGVKFWWCPAPPGGPHPSPAGRLDSTPAARPSLPYPSLGGLPNSSQLSVLSFPIPFFSYLSPFLSACFACARFGLSFPHSVSCFSWLGSLFIRMLFILFLFSFFCQPYPQSLLPYLPIAPVSVARPPYNLWVLCLSPSRLWGLPFIPCPPFRVLM